MSGLDSLGPSEGLRGLEEKQALAVPFPELGQGNAHGLRQGRTALSWAGPKGLARWTEPRTTVMAHTRFPHTSAEGNKDTVKTGNFSINKRSWGTGRSPRGFHNLTFQKHKQWQGWVGARGGASQPPPCPEDRGAHCGAVAFVGGDFSPGVTSHVLGTGMRQTLIFQRKESLYLAVGGDKAEATRATTSPQCLGQFGGPSTPQICAGWRTGAAPPS